MRNSYWIIIAAVVVILQPLIHTIFLEISSGKKKILSIVYPRDVVLIKPRSSSMGLLDLLVASSMPVIKVLLITALGSLLALDRVNILGDDARKHANKIVFYVFNPALVASHLARTITRERMSLLWFMLVNILITFIIGSLLGYIVIHITKAPLHLRGLVIGCCAAGNLGNMLLIILPAVCKEKGTPFGDPSDCQKYGMAYASLSMAIGAIYLWSYVYNIVRISSNNHHKEVEISDTSIDKSTNEASISDTSDCEEPLLQSNEYGTPRGHEQQLAPTCSRNERSAVVLLAGKLKHHTWQLFGKINLKTIFAPSTAAAIAGFVVGLVPVIRKSLVTDGAPLHVIQDSALLLADGSIPSVTLVMGGNLLKGLQGSDIQKSLVIGIIIARYIALPLTGILVVQGAVHLGVITPDPLYQFVLLLQFAVPPAMNIGTITQLFGAGETECSVIMLWTYALASISLTLWSTFFMWLVA